MFEAESAQQKGIPSAIVDWIVERLSEAGLLVPVSMLGHRVFATNDGLAKFLFERGCIHNALFGFGFIVDRYGPSVLKIVVIDERQDAHIGTGFLMRFPKGGGVKSVLLTNEHVAKYEQGLRVLTKNNDTIEHSRIIHSTKNGEDLALIEMSEDQPRASFNLHESPNVLDEVITLGFPNVAMTRDSFQLAHRGEINSVVQDRAGNDLILFSAKTAPGNSGGPLIDAYGLVVGMVAEDLFYKDALIEKGQLPYHAAIPAKTIREFLNRDYLT